MAFFVSSEELQGESQFSQAELAQILAPIALYPDSLLTHILIAATYPLEVIEASRWLEDNRNIDPYLISEKIENKQWDPSVKALVPFPQVLERLNNDLQWTQKLGDAFLQNEQLVLSSIQLLRQQAKQAGHLTQMEKLTVAEEDNNIIIQSSEPEIIYVPYYDTRVVYGNWYWRHYPPVYWNSNWNRHHNHYSFVEVGLFSWYPSVHISFDYFFNAFHWHNRHVVVFSDYKRSRDNYRHRRIVNNRHVKRWHHNPVHRRGVAYRSEHIKNKYRSNRPSINQSQRVRANEQQLLTSRQVINSRMNKSSTGSPRVKQVLTRHERLKKQVTQEKSKSRVINNRKIDLNNNRIVERHKKELRKSVVAERSTKQMAPVNNVTLPKLRIKTERPVIKSKSNDKQKSIHRVRVKPPKISQKSRKETHSNKRERRLAHK